jgi:hypothetical protein
VNGKNAKISDNTITLYFDIEALGYGGIYAASKSIITDAFYDFLDTMNVNFLLIFSSHYFRK